MKTILQESGPQQIPWRKDRDSRST